MIAVPVGSDPTPTPPPAPQRPTPFPPHPGPTHPTPTGPGRVFAGHLPIGAKSPARQTSVVFADEPVTQSPPAGSRVGGPLAPGAGMISDPRPSSATLLERLSPGVGPAMPQPRALNFDCRCLHCRETRLAALAAVNESLNRRAS